MSTAADSFAAAVEALEATEVYPMFSREYRAAAQRALQEFNVAAATAGTTIGQTRFAGLADRLAAYLAIDWSLIDIVEVRLRDGSTEDIDLRDGPDATRRLYGVDAFRIVAARNDS